MRIESDQWKTAALLAGMAGLFVLAVGLPSRAHGRQLAQRRTDAESLLQEGAAAREQAVALQMRVSELRELVEATSRHVPREPQLAQLMRDLSQTLDQHDARNVSTRHGDEFHGAKYNIVPITLQFRASFVNVFLIVERIESMHRLVRVDKLDVLGSRNEPDALLDVSLQISAFHAPQEVD